MENLKKDYPSLFKLKSFVASGNKQRPRKILWLENTPIIKKFATHYEVRKLKHSSPLILNKNYVL